MKFVQKLSEMISTLVLFDLFFMWLIRLVNVLNFFDWTESKLGSQVFCQLTCPIVGREHILLIGLFVLILFRIVLDKERRKDIQERQR